VTPVSITAIPEVLAVFVMLRFWELMLRLRSETIDNLLQRAKTSIGTRQGEAVVNNQLRMIVDYLDFMDDQVEQIGRELRCRMEALNCPIMSLGIGPESLFGRSTGAATILAESGAVERFAGPREYAAFCGLMNLS